MPTFLKMLLPPLVGGLLAFLVVFTLTWSQTRAPDTNPADKPVLTYGDN